MSLFSRLFGRAERGVANVRDAEGFRMATPQELLAEAAAVWKMGRDAQDDVEKLVLFVRAAEDLIARKVEMPHGVRVGAVVHGWAGAFETWLGEGAREDWGAPFREVHEKCQSPLSAALYAQVCNALAFDARGTSWAKNVTDEQWANMAKWQQRAMEALGAFGDDYVVALEAGQGHVFQPWATAYFNLVASSAGGAEPLLEAYEYLSAPDPDDLYLMISVGHWLMPRWSRAPLEVFDSFARHCMDRTREKYGRGAYSYVYAALQEYEDIEDTPCDPQLLDGGWRDLRERRPCVRLQNLHVSALQWAGLDEEAWVELARNMRAVDAISWTDDGDDQAMEQVMTYYSALRASRA